MTASKCPECHATLGVVVGTVADPIRDRFTDPVVGEHPPLLGWAPRLARFAACPSCDFCIEF